jgi:hypothetical protein
MYRKERKLLAADPEVHAFVMTFANKYGLKMTEAAYILIGRALAVDFGADPKQVKLLNKMV